MFRTLSIAALLLLAPAAADPRRLEELRARIRDNFILKLDASCTGACHDAVRARLGHRSRCTDITFLEHINMVTATCPGQGANEAMGGLLEAIDGVRAAKADRAGAYLFPTETQPANKTWAVKRGRSLRGLQSSAPYSWGLDRVDQVRGGR
jgi:hypothetical protein